MNADRKVLLVEDEVLVAALAVDALEELGYQTVEATTAKARAGDPSAARRPFTFAVIDMGLPDGRGDALAIELRQHAPELADHHRHRIRRSAAGREPARTTAQTAVLRKPYDIAQLKAAIESIS